MDNEKKSMQGIMGTGLVSRWFWLLSKMRAYYVAQASLKVMILPPHHPGNLDYRHVPLYLTTW